MEMVTRIFCIFAETSLICNIRTRLEVNWEIHASALWSFTKNWRKVCPPLVNLIEIDQSFFFQLNTGPLPFDLVNQFGSTRRCIKTWRPTRFQLFIFLFGVKLTNEGACLREDNLDNETLILKNADIVVQTLRGFESFVVVRWKLLLVFVDC